MMTSLDLRNMYIPELEKLNCSGNQLTSLVVSDTPKLYSLSCCNNIISVLDITECDRLVEIYKNGTIDTGSSVYVKYSDSYGELVVDPNVDVICRLMGEISWASYYVLELPPRCL